MELEQARTLRKLRGRLLKLAAAAATRADDWRGKLAKARGLDLIDCKRMESTLARNEQLAGAWTQYAAGVAAALAALGHAISDQQEIPFNDQAQKQEANPANPEGEAQQAGIGGDDGACDGADADAQDVDGEDVDW